MAWEPIRGGPIEVVSRMVGGGWTRPAALSSAVARFPALAVAANDTAVAAWQTNRNGRPHLEVSLRDAALTWDAPRRLGAEGAQDPDVGISAAGDALVVWTRRVTDRAIVEVATGANGAAWQPPTQLTQTGTAQRVRIAVAPSGAAIVVWEDHGVSPSRVMAAVRTEGQWTAPAPVSASRREGQNAEVAIDARGAASVVWIEERGDGFIIVARRFTRDGWGPPTPVASAPKPAERLLRPRRNDLGADIAVTPDGRAVVVWAARDDDHSTIHAALENGAGRWSPPRQLSSPDGQATSPEVQIGAGGVPLAAWEELDNGLVRARVARLGGETSTISCADLDRTGGETAGPRLAGGSAPMAALVDLDRNEIRLARVP